MNFCLYCNKTFRDAPSLDRHIREAYADVFRCPLCTKGMLRGSAQRHMKKKHSDICDPAKGTLDNTITMLQHKKRTSSQGRRRVPRGRPSQGELHRPNHPALGPSIRHSSPSPLPGEQGHANPPEKGRKR